MFDRKGTLGLAVCAALASAGWVWGGETPAGAAPAGGPEAGLIQDGLTLTSPAYMDDAAPAPADATPPPPPDKPLMYLLKQVGVGQALADANINLYGYVEGGYTYTSRKYDTRTPITGNVFNTKDRRVVLDQADFTIERTVDAAAAAKNHTFDFGFRGDFIYGWDTGSFHSNGLFDNAQTSSRTSPYYKSRFSPENQFDVNQAYLDFALPVGNGLRLRVGKFVTLLGQEVIAPTGNALYSHSYLFGFAIPFTQTGILATYAINDAITIDAGATLGWNQSIQDNNSAVDFLGRVTWTYSKATSFFLTLSEGPQVTGDDSDYWTVVDFIATHTFADNLTGAVNADYGDAPHALGTKSAQWYGVAGYLSLTLDPHFTVNARGEWYRDNDGFTLGVNTSVYEGTIGLAITPFPDDKIAKNFMVRPEFRYDYAEKNFFNGGTQHTQCQFAVDAIFAF